LLENLIFFLWYIRCSAVLATYCLGICAPCNLFDFIYCWKRMSEAQILFSIT
jgi:hypothetical protein